MPFSTAGVDQMAAPVWKGRQVFDLALGPPPADASSQVTGHLINGVEEPVLGADVDQVSDHQRSVVHPDNVGLALVGGEGPTFLDTLEAVVEVGLYLALLGADVDQTVLAGRRVPAGAFASDVPGAGG